MTAARSGPTRRGRPRARRAAGARVSTRGPLRIGHFERYKSHGARPMNAGEADVGERGRFAAAPRPSRATMSRDAEPARRGSAGARVPAWRGPRVALRAPRAAPAGRPGADPQGPRGGPPGDARRLPLQEDRFLAGP